MPIFRSQLYNMVKRFKGDRVILCCLKDSQEVAKLVTPIAQEKICRSNGSIPQKCRALGAKYTATIVTIQVLE